MTKYKVIAQALYALGFEQMGKLSDIECKLILDAARSLEDLIEEIEAIKTDYRVMSEELDTEIAYLTQELSWYER